jgi:ubiquinone/menaquinone biosynthesis C-methylase UbiE
MTETQGHHHGAGHGPGRRFPAEQWTRLLSDERRAMLDPDRFLARLDVRAGATVADLGAGPGFFTLPLARYVGESGRVFAVDVSPDMIEVLRQRLADHGGMSQVVAVVSTEHELPIPDHAVELALLAFVLHEIADPDVFLAGVRRVLAPGGRLVVLEWAPREESVGPPLHERLPVTESERILTRAGFEVVERGEANASNYFLIATVTRGGRSRGA